MTKLFCLTLLVIFVALKNKGGDGAECCSAYTNRAKEYKPTFPCEDYCCIDASVSWSIGLAYDKICCNTETRRVPSNMRIKECLKNWLQDNIWMPIVAGVVGLIIIVVIVVCCCCRRKAAMNNSDEISNT